MSIQYMSAAKADLLNPEAPSLGQVLYFGHDEAIIAAFGGYLLTPPQSFLTGTREERLLRYEQWVEGGLRSSARSRRERAVAGLDHICDYTRSGRRHLVIVADDDQMSPEVEVLIRMAEEHYELYYI